MQQIVIAFLLSIAALPAAALVRDCHGIAIDDPYAWLEEETPATLGWLDRQAGIFEGYMAQNPYREGFADRLSAFCRCDHYGVPLTAGQRTFFMQRGAGREHASLYMQEGDEEAVELLDPHPLNGNSVISIAGFVPSPDGRFVAVGLMENGSDWTEWRVIDAQTGAFTGDRVDRLKFFGVVWDDHSRGFYYSRYNDAEKNEVGYRRLGEEAGTQIYSYEGTEEALLQPILSHDGRYLLIGLFHGANDAAGLLVKDLGEEGGSFRQLLAPGVARYSYIHNEGAEFYFMTDEGAPNGKVVVVDIAAQRLQVKKTLIPEGTSPLDACVAAGGKFVVCRLVDTYGELTLYDKGGRLERKIPLPAPGTVNSNYRDLFLSGSDGSPWLYFGFTSFTTPLRIYRYNVDSDALSLFKAPDVPFDTDGYTIKQVFYPSKDGTRVPMSIVHKNGIDIARHPPTLLYGYGGFSLSIVPEFNPSHFAWIERGGILAIANIRGGGEYGEMWHRSGMGANKQNVFDDFIAAAEWLIDNGYTEPARLACAGRSNGGLLAGACVTQRPDLFGAASVEVGVLDMLRFHLFTVGWAWTGEYGHPDNKDDFDVLRRYSPYHNVVDRVAYPATLISTAAHDDRVVPLHSFKFAAALQAANSSGAPVLLRCESNAGHGAGKGAAQKVAEWADIHSFLWRELTQGGN